MSHATHAANGYQKHTTNTRVYVMHALGSKWHIVKKGHGHKRTVTGKLGKCTTRFVATEQVARGRILAKDTLHELVAALKAHEHQNAMQAELFA
jgi:hypothetical protein